MKKITKIALSALSLASVAALSIAGTVAYLTDRDSKANIFTVGDVDIALSEDFEQGATLIPGEKIEKKPVITNTGDSDAWVWATIAIPSALDDEDASKNAVHFNYSGDYVNDTQWTWQDSDGWMVDSAEIDGVAYNVYTVLYQTALKPGDATPEVITRVYMDYHIDITPEGQLNHVEGGEINEVDWNINEDGAPIIYVNAYGMQTSGFASVQEAYAAYAAQWADKGGVENSVAKAATEADLADLAGNVIVDTDIELAEAITALNNEATIVLNGGSITADRNDTSGADKFSTLTVYGDVTIGGNGTIENKNGYTISVRDENAKLTINGGTYKGNNASVINVVYGDLVINGGHFELGEGCDTTFLINCYDASYNSGIATVTITGGTFVNFNPADNEAETGDHINFVADGYTVVAETQANGDVWYTVVAE